ncbi:MAG: hypothetical protein EPN97_16320 [Alphaproteobacteria bacterium]|nr:MAG: hypothetical protein EPN97_16320 [Alphaproteobacteria bacterium]
MPPRKPTLYEKLESHFNKAAAGNEHYAKLCGAVLEHNKDHLEGRKLEVPFSYMDQTFSRILDDANKIIRDHKGPAV